MTAGNLELVPVDWQTARLFCGSWHRHHPKPPPGHLWRHGVAADGVLVGVAIVGRPVARHFDDGLTVEVNRTVTDGHPNANSMLYGAVARAAFAKGYRRVVFFTAFVFILALVVTAALGAMPSASRVFREVPGAGNAA